MQLHTFSRSLCLPFSAPKHFSLFPVFPRYLSQLFPSVSLSTLSLGISLNSFPRYLSQLFPSVPLSALSLSISLSTLSLGISLNSFPRYLSQLFPSVSLSALSLSISLNSVPTFFCILSVFLFHCVVSRHS